MVLGLVVGVGGPGLARLRLVSLLDAGAYLLLLGAVVVERTGGPPTGVTVLGPVHGVLYLVLVGLLIVARHRLRWGVVEVVTAAFVAGLPLGGFWLHQKLGEPLRSQPEVGSGL